MAAVVLLLCSCASVGTNAVGPSAGGRSDQMVTIPEGPFRMGINGTETNEGPEHTVFLSRYEIGKYEVSAADFARFLNEKGNEGNKYFAPDDRSTIEQMKEAGGKDSAPRFSYAPKKGYENYPVNNVSWLGADEYCRWKGERLPTEAEWEKAARGTDGRRYPWGDSAPEDTKARFHREESEGPGAMVSVDSLKEGVSFYGVYNMAGNALEWVNDWYRLNYCDFCGESAGEYAMAAADLLCIDKKIFAIKTEQKKTDVVEYNDPQGPEIGSFKALRGGSWHDKTAAFLRSTRRFWLDPSERNPYTGFRCASGEIKQARIATPQEVRQALKDCLPEEVKPAVVVTNEIAPPPPPAQIDVLSSTVPVREVIEKTPCPPGLENVYFSKRHWDVPADGKLVLQAVAEWMKRYPEARLIIEGRGDQEGKRPCNLALAEKRANAMRVYLIALGVSEYRLDMESYGDVQRLCADARKRARTIVKHLHVQQPQKTGMHKPNERKKAVPKKEIVAKANGSVQIITIEKECIQ